jgi:hypothetical protein
MRDALAILISLAAGLFLARYDLNTDDSGIEVGLLLIASLGLALLAPRRWWLVAVCVGLPIPIVEVLVGRAAVPPAGVAALGVAIVGALVGFGIARASRSSSPA